MEQDRTGLQILKMDGTRVLCKIVDCDFDFSSDPLLFEKLSHSLLILPTLFVVKSHCNDPEIKLPALPAANAFLSDKYFLISGSNCKSKCLNFSVASWRAYTNACS